MYIDCSLYSLQNGRYIRFDSMHVHLSSVGSNLKVEISFRPVEPVIVSLYV